MDVYTLPWIVFITGVYMVPFVFLFVSAGLSGLNQSLENAARVAGARWLEAQLLVKLPLLKPAFLYSTTIILLLGLGQFTVPLLLGRQHGIDVITTEMFRQTNTTPVDFTAASALAVPIVAFAALAVWWQKRTIGSLSLYASTRQGTRPFVSSRGRGLAGALVAIYAVGALLPPLTGLVLVSLSRFWSGKIELDQMGLHNFTALWRDEGIRGAILNSITFAIAGTLVTLALSLAVALFLRRRAEHRSGRALEYVVNLPLTVPAIVFGMGLFLAYALPPLRLLGSALLFVLAYFIVLLPFGVRLAQSGLSQIGWELEGAARVFGDGPLRTKVDVTFPLLRQNLAAAAVIMFVIITQEFAASIMLRTPQTQVMATKLLDLFEFGNYSQVAALALTMVLVSGLGVLSILWIGRSGPGNEKARTRGRRGRVRAADTGSVD